MDKQYEDFLPLTETTFFILLSIAAVPKHGYAIVKKVQQLSRGRVNLSAGTLYGAIKRLLEAGLIERAQENEAEINNPRNKKTYQLTELGKQVLSAENHRLRQLVSAAKTHLDKRGFHDEMGYAN